MVQSNGDKMLNMREVVEMTEPLTITTERVDDPPMVLAQSDPMGISELLDDCFKPHGNSVFSARQRWRRSAGRSVSRVLNGHVGGKRSNAIRPWRVRRHTPSERASDQSRVQARRIS